MTRITISNQAQTDPNIQFIKDFNLAFATCDVDYISSCFANDATWEMVGGGSWTGKQAINQSLATMGTDVATEMIIDSVITSENRCATNGTLKYEGGRGVAYCDVYTFINQGADMKIKTLTAYAIELQA